MRNYITSISIMLLLASPVFAGQVLFWDPCTVYDPCVLDGNDYIGIGAGYGHCLAIRGDGSLVAWGENDFNQCNVPENGVFTKVDGGIDHSIALRDDNSLAAWGSNYYGECDVPPESDYIDISTTRYHNLALKSDGSLAAWGRNDYGQCDVPDGNDYIAIAAGGYHNLAMKSDKSVVGWGRNTNGQLDIPDVNFIAIAAGCHYNLGITKDNSLVAWGYNYFGQCDVPAGNDYIGITCAYDYGLALKSDGSLASWGAIGDIVPAGNDFATIAASRDDGVGLTSDETITLTIQTDPETDPADMCVAPDIGVHTYCLGARVYINAYVCAKCPDVYGFHHWLGDVIDPCSSSTYLDMTTSKSITAVFEADERVCGDECHPILQGDLNEDCYINFDDFSIYADNWLSCTAPECD